MEYHVVWEIDLEAEDPEEAAREALRIQRDPESTALVFCVFEHAEYSPMGLGRRTCVDLERKENKDV